MWADAFPRSVLTHGSVLGFDPWEGLDGMVSPNPAQLQLCSPGCCDKGGGGGCGGPSVAPRGSKAAGWHSRTSFRTSNPISISPLALSHFSNLLGLLKSPGRIFWLSFVRQGHFDRYQNASAAAKIRSVNEQRPPRSWSPAQHWDFGTERRCLSWALALPGRPCPSSKLWSS